MRISAPGDCNHALRQSSGVFAVQIGLTTSGSGDGRGATNSDDDGDLQFASKTSTLTRDLRMLENIDSLWLIVRLVMTLVRWLGRTRSDADGSCCKYLAKCVCGTALVVRAPSNPARIVRLQLLLIWRWTPSAGVRNCGPFHALFRLCQSVAGAIYYAIAVRFPQGPAKRPGVGWG